MTNNKEKTLPSIQKVPQIGPFMKFENGLCHPPKNPVAATKATINIFAYSLRKNIDHLKPEYSV
tara:strand:+ start:382 stop:573 length:192 start_codon:yes stop_codon:yes gene_type:complete